MTDTPAVSTASEDVEHMARVLEAEGRLMLAGMFRALAKERDALRADVEALRPLSLTSDRLTAERDAARAP